MTVILFSDQFAEKVRNGTKSRTLRAPRKRPIKVGDKLSLRRWTGLPYRSKQEVLREVVCCSVREVLIQPDFIFVDKQKVDHDDWFAQQDGFVDADDMRQWFSKVHGLPFGCDLIQWG